MKVRKLLAAVSLAGAVTIGIAGVAGAQTVDPSTSTPKLTCAQATALLAKADSRVTDIEARVAKATTKRDELQANGHAKLADKLTVRIDKANDRLAKVAPRMDKLHHAVAARCDTPASPQP